VTCAVLVREEQTVMAAVTHSSAARPLGSASHICEELENLLTLMINLKKKKINYRHHHHKTQNYFNISLSISCL
jgi:mannose-6-phosphate isomerase-like protein (cupin superfamily)